MNRTQARENLRFAVERIVTLLEVKRRDRREPHRKEKEEAEEKLMMLFRRIFRKQRIKVQRALEAAAPDRKATMVGHIEFDEDFEPDDIADLIRQLQAMVKNGITVFGDAVGVAIDYTRTNMDAAQWAYNYAYDLVRNINQTTRETLQRVITMFIETPGMTIRDVINNLPFNEQRALSIATTETTRAYAQGQQMAGERMKEEFPDVKVIKMWFTNNDDRVCPICAPLDGQEVELNDKFPGDIDNPPAHVNCRCWTETTTDIGG